MDWKKGKELKVLKKTFYNTKTNKSHMKYLRVIVFFKKSVRKIISDPVGVCYFRAITAWKKKLFYTVIELMRKLSVTH